MVAVVWGQGRWRAVSGIAELDALLAGLAVTSRGPHVVGLYPPRFLEPGFRPGTPPALPSLQLGLGHPMRGFLYWAGPTGSLGYEPELPPWPAEVERIEFDYGGDPIACGPKLATVTPGAVRDAALEYAATGARPTRVGWRDS
ncbi:Imm1 family immunity protein [Plantactinospora sp. KLBMP9567]|uniref:Imm1 family immunity protein n=1 Tax=Plantactinospora sp. KLBMP9567 TaxID=3085900 RepID=UPI002980A930|nr:Imm1 family immunity protein [Plantactinospora sp. KLBMP9567]MDW5324974.1 Imm1 family immunity protein [Plantactinospora sp. KLBMP9567]